MAGIKKWPGIDRAISNYQWHVEACRPESLCRENVACLQAFLARGNVESDLLAFFQGLETIALDRGKVSEEIFTTLVRRNKTKAFGIVKPLDCTCCHILNLQQKINGGKPLEWGEYQDGEVKMGEFRRSTAGNKPTKNNTMLEIAGADYALSREKLQTIIASPHHKFGK